MQPKKSQKGNGKKKAPAGPSSSSQASSSQVPKPMIPVGNTDSGDDDFDAFDDMVDFMQKEMANLQENTQKTQEKLARLALDSKSVDELYFKLRETYRQMKVGREWIDHSKRQIRTAVNVLAATPAVSLEPIADEAELDLCPCESCGAARA